MSLIEKKTIQNVIPHNQKKYLGASFSTSKTPTEDCRKNRIIMRIELV